MKFSELITRSGKVSELTKQLADMTADRDAQLAKMTEFEQTHKDYIESAITADAMKQAHSTELATIKAEYEAKLTEKDKELSTVKESLTKQVETVKAEAEQTISTVKESVAAETIALVASQGTNVVLEAVVESLTPEKAMEQFKALKGKEAQEFYKTNYSLFESYRKNPTKK